MPSTGKTTKKAPAKKSAPKKSVVAKAPAKKAAPKRPGATKAAPKKPIKKVLATKAAPKKTNAKKAPAKPVKSKTPPVLARVRVQIRLHWAWDGPETQLTRIGIGRLPAGASLAVGCRGHGCPRPARRLAAGSRQIGALLRALHGLRYRAGDRLTIVLAVPRMISERAEILIRDGKLPRVRAV